MCFPFQSQHTIRYDRKYVTCTEKTTESQLHLAHGKVRKKTTKSKTDIAQEKLVSDIAVFVLTRDVKLQLTHSLSHSGETVLHNIRKYEFI